MRRCVPRPRWAEQKLHAKAAAEKQQSITLVNQSFDERKIVGLRSHTSQKKRPGEARPMLASRCAPERSAYAICYRFSHSDDRWSRTNDWQFW